MKNLVKAEPVSLDALWNKAESLGDVSVENKRWKDFYEVEIYFKSPSESEIHAKGKDSDIVIALARAISEAERMKG